MKNLLLFLSVVSLLTAQPQQVNLTAAPPAPIASVSVSLVGNPGNATYCYYVVAIYPRGKSFPTGPACVFNAPSTLTGSNYVSVAWTAAPGATGYDVIRTASGIFPSAGTCAGCAVSTAQAGVSVNDQGGALGSYTLTIATSAAANLVLNNRDYAAPRLVSDVAMQVPSLAFPDGSTQATAGGVANVLQGVGNPNGAQTCSVPSPTSLTFYRDTSAAVGKNMWICTGPNQFSQLQATNPGDAFLLAGLEGAPPGTPAANNQTCWFDSTDHQYECKNSSGTVYKLGSGGGGPSITQGTFAALPGTCTTNDLYLITSGLFTASRCASANTWNHFYAGRVISPTSTLAGLATTLQASVTQNTTNGYGVMNFPSGGATTTSWWETTAPAAPYTKYVTLRIPAAVSAAGPPYTAFEAGFMDGAGLQVRLEVTVTNDSYYRISWGTNGGYTGDAGQLIWKIPASGDVVIALNDDNTNLNFSVGTDQSNLHAVGSIGRTAHSAAPTKLFVGGYNSSAAAWAMTFVGIN